MINIPALQEYFIEQSQLPQKLGVFDCVTFVSGAVKVGWDRNFDPILQYSDRRSAIKRLRELGGLEAACDLAMGKRVSVSMLEPGDVVWYDEPATIGLLMYGYVAVKLGGNIHRFEIDPEMTGWSTQGGLAHGR